jgi:hypothetical protein
VNHLGRIDRAVECLFSHKSQLQCRLPDREVVVRRVLAVPPAGQFGNAGRNIPWGPAFAQFDPALHKDFAITDGRKIALGVDTYNLFTIRIVAFRVIHKVRLAWEVTGMPSSRMPRVISPMTQAKS